MFLTVMRQTQHDYIQTPKKAFLKAKTLNKEICGEAKNITEFTRWTSWSNAKKLNANKRPQVKWPQLQREIVDWIEALAVIVTFS